MSNYHEPYVPTGNSHDGVGEGEREGGLIGERKSFPGDD